MKTRKQYLNREISHKEYYGQFAPSLVDLVSRHIGVQTIQESTDPHLNDIPLERWDSLFSFVVNSQTGRDIAKANGGGGISLIDAVCALKAAARIIRDGESKS